MPRAAETLVQGVRRGVRLAEVLGVRRQQDGVGVGVAGFTVDAVTQDLLGSIADHDAVAGGSVGAGGRGVSQAFALAGEAVKPHLSLH